MMQNLKEFSARAVEAFAATGLPTSFALAKADDSYEMTIYDVIGSDATNAANFADALKQAGGAPLTIRLSSPGGSVFEGFAMFNALKAYEGETTVIVDGIAASIASVFALAADNVVTQKTSMWMIHNAWMISVGNAEDFRAAAETLDKIDESLVAIYADRTGQSDEAIREQMAAETWYTAAEAVEFGLATGLAEAPPSKAEAKAKLDAKLQKVRALTAECQRVENTIQAQMAPLGVYDPDGDGDDDAAEASDLIRSAIVLLQNALETLDPAPGEQDDDGNAAAQARAALDKALMERRARIAKMKSF